MPALAKASACKHSASVGKRQGMSAVCARNASASRRKKARGAGVVLRIRARLKGKRLVRNMTVDDKPSSNSSAALGLRW